MKKKIKKRKYVRKVKPNGGIIVTDAEVLAELSKPVSTPRRRYPPPSRPFPQTVADAWDAMKEAGFSKAVVFWETEHKGKGTGEYLPATEGDNAYSWIAYAVGIV